MLINTAQYALCDSPCSQWYLESQFTTAVHGVDDRGNSWS